MIDKQFKYRRPKDTWFYQLAFIALIGLFGYIVIQEIAGLITKYSHLKLLIFLSFVSIISIIIYILYQILRMRYEYDAIDRNKEIEIDIAERKLFIKKDSIETTISNESIDSVEIYESKIATYPLSSFEFIKIKTKSGENIAITNLTIPLIENELNPVLKGIKIKREKRIINRLK
ncbi:hypothetical protein [Tenuifilum osseticum]|uniref:hypothetical protein n=1 Tax=Tenuifilum osseticum TaxID=3374723 RepID=UPI0034E5738E